MSRKGYSVDLLVCIDMCFILEDSKSTHADITYRLWNNVCLKCFDIHLNIKSNALLSLILQNLLKHDPETWFIHFLLHHFDSNWYNFILVKLSHKYYIKQREILVRLTLIARNKVVFLYTILGIPIHILT